jgi:release factor glutamine methyltransferase
VPRATDADGGSVTQMAESSAPSIAVVLQAATRRLSNSPSARLDAELLLADTLGLSRAGLLARGREPLAPAAGPAFEEHIARRAAGEPVAYIVGSAEFYGLHLVVTPDVLIPRPETELLAEWAVHWAQERSGPIRVLDAGTGSGALALAVAAHVPTSSVVAVDISDAALMVAAVNVAHHGLAEMVTLVMADLLPPGDEPFDLVMANLPYVAEDDHDLEASVRRYEPHVALFAGHDGLSVIRRLLVSLPGRLAPDGAVGLEIGWRQGAAVSALAGAAFPDAHVAVHQDLAGLDRWVTVEQRG